MGLGLLFFRFQDVMFYEERLSAPNPIPNLENLVSVAPRERVLRLDIP